MFHSDLSKGNGKATLREEMGSIPLELRSVLRTVLYPRVYLPLFITSCSLLLMLSVLFFCTDRNHRGTQSPSQENSPRNGRNREPAEVAWGSYRLLRGSHRIEQPLATTGSGGGAKGCGEQAAAR